MKRMHIITLCCCLWFSLLWGSKVFALTPTDISTHHYRESIQYLYDHGVVEGYPDGTFKPDREVSRAEIMKIILASRFDDIGTWSDCFPDVQTQWYASYVCYAKNHAIVQWYPDGLFKPSKTVIFAEAFKMALETFDAKTVSANSSDAWYQKYVDFVHDNSIFSKYALYPDENITRGEMSYLIHKLMLEKEGSLVLNGVRDAASPWCGKTQPEKRTSSLVDGQVRNYITEIGNKYTQTKPIKLIVAFHGRTNSNEEVRSYYDINDESHGNAIIVYPSGLPEATSPRTRSNGWDKPYALRDFALFDQIVEDFTNEYCIDMDQIFVVGHSLWAWFTNTLACTRGDVIRAIWSVGGGTTITTCNGPIAAITMQNLDDNLSSYASAVTARDQMLRQNNCTSETEPYGSVGNCVIYINCQKDAPVIWCPYTESYTSNGSYYPHQWPDYAGKTIMDFFESL